MHKHLLLLSLLITGCADLADLQPDGTCGNKILEANANEDCDGFALGDGLSCGQPSTAGACRYVCRPLVLGTACPAGWGCGIDGICRAPGPGLTESANRVILPVTLARDLKVADVDGDRRMDVTGLIGPEVRVLYGDSRGAFEQKATLTVGTPLGEILVEDLDSDQRADLVVPQIPGPLVVRGRADGALEPIPYGAVVASPDYLDRPGFRVLTVRSDEPELETSFTIATTFSDRVEMEFPRAMTSAVAPGVRAKIEGASELATNIPVESKTAGAPMRTDGVDRVALSFSFTNTIYVLQTRCARPGAGLVCAVEGVEAVALFPSATITEGAHFADVNGDGQMDLIGLGDGTEGAMVAFGRPNGRFCPTLGPCATSSMRRLEFFDRVGNPVMGHGPLLAVGDVDEDRFSDYVFAEGVVTVTGTITPNGDISARATAVATPRAQASWTAAAIGDFNRDGFADVATAYPGENGVEFLIGTGRRFFNRQRTPTTSPPDSIVGLIVGDFDGDLFQDVAVAQEDGAVSVLYGDPQGAPDDVVSMGKFNAVSGLAAGDLAIPGEAQQDLVTDLIVVSSSTAEGALINLVTDLIGTGERRMVAPLTFDDGVTQGLPRSLVVGDFGSNFDGLPDLAGLSFRRLLNNGTPVTSLWIAEARNNGGLFPSQAMSRQPMVGDCALACAAGAFFRKIHDQRLLIVEDPSACFQIEPQMIDPRAPMIVDISWRGDELDLRCERLPVPSAEAGRANIEEVYVEDVDHDGQVDLIVRQGTNFLEEPPDSSGTFFFPAAYVYFGPLDASPEAVVITPSNPFNGFIGPFDVVDIDGDDLVDLVVFDLQGIGVGQLGRDGRYAVDSRLVAFETTEDEEIEPLPDERFGRDDPELFGQTAVRVLDANGDGLQDLMLLSDFEIIVGLRVVCTAAGAERGACERFEPGAEQ